MENEKQFSHTPTGIKLLAIFIATLVKEEIVFTIQEKVDHTVVIINGNY